MIIAYLILAFAVVALILILLNVPVSQKAINIILLVIAVLIAVSRLEWIKY